MKASFLCGKYLLRKEELISAADTFFLFTELFGALRDMYPIELQF